ncbi:MAG: hypothetical protein RQ758_03250 [Methanomicrobiaceae archaeon]|nr:hypothetical protein [Methanomicrobiaceae archaeon]
MTGEHYNLNLHFKENYKEDWNANSTDRHTMFLPYTTPTDIISVDEGTCLYDKDGSLLNPDTDGDGLCEAYVLPGVQLYISQGDEWAVIDANCYDGVCALQLPRGRYKVFAVARAKPGGFTDISGWLYYDYTDESGNTEYYFELGDIHVTKKTEWDNITEMFYVLPAQDKYGLFEEGGEFYESSSAWVFEYLDELYGEGYDGGYFWQIVNGGNKLVKVRFYPV